MGIEMMLDKSNAQYALAPLGLPVAIGGIVIDTIKAPICIAIAAEEAARAGISKVLSLLFDGAPEENQSKRIFQSFILRMKQTAAILIALDLEDEKNLQTKLAAGNIEELVGLTLLHTAYASRHGLNELLLASGKSLSRNDCPKSGLHLYDTIMGLKQTIKDALILANPALQFASDTHLEESRIVCQWIKAIKARLEITQNDRPDATDKQLAIVNVIISQIKELQQIGMNMLPESPKSVVRQMGK